MSATKNLALLSSAARLGLFAQRMTSSAYYTAGTPGAATPTRSQETLQRTYTAEGTAALLVHCWPSYATNRLRVF